VLKRKLFALLLTFFTLGSFGISVNTDDIQFRGLVSKIIQENL
jgi:hypothetical protein